MSESSPCDPDDPVIDKGRANSSPWTEPPVCPIAVPNNTGEVVWIDGKPVFLLGPGIGSAPGGGPDCPPVPPPPVAFITGAENVGTGTGLYLQTVNGVIQLMSLAEGSNISFAVVNNTLVISASGGLTAVAWDDVSGKPVVFPPSPHATTHVDGTDDIQSATAAQKGLATGAHIAKLDGIAAGATVGATWGSNVTSQPSVVSQAEAEAGVAATERIWTAERVAQAIAALAPSGGAIATDVLWDAAGDLAVGTGANTAARLPIGTAGQVLTVNAGATAAEWAAASGGSGGAVNMLTIQSFI